MHNQGHMPIQPRKSDQGWGGSSRVKVYEGGQQENVALCFSFCELCRDMSKLLHDNYIEFKTNDSPELRGIKLSKSHILPSAE